MNFVSGLVKGSRPASAAQALISAAGATLWLASAQAAQPNPQFWGTWEVDLTKVAPPDPAAGPLPKSVTFVFKDAGNHKVAYTETIVGADGKKTEPLNGTFSTDGTPSPIAGDPNIDSITVTYPDPNTEVVIESKGGKQVAKLTTKLSADGRHRTLSEDGADLNGKPVHTVTTLNKK